MASSKEYLDFILDQLSGLDEISYRAMMGEYIIYYRGKIIGGIYHLIARRPLPQFTSSTVDRSELRSLRVNREGMNCLRMYLPYL